MQIYGRFRPCLVDKYRKNSDPLGKKDGSESLTETHNFGKQHLCFSKNAMFQLLL